MFLTKSRAGESMSRESTAVVLCLVFGPSCVADRPPLDPWNGEYIRYESSQSLAVCAGTREYVDGFVPFLANELGVEIPDERIIFRWLSSDDYGAWAGYCGSPYGCTRGSVANSARPILLHELVHALAHGVYGLPGTAFFVEGLAEAYGAVDYGLPRFPYEVGDPRVTMDAMTSDDVNYLDAGGFVTFMLTRHGPAAFGEFYRGGSGRRTMAEIRADFLAAFGAELDAEVERYMQLGVEGAGGCEDLKFDVLPYDCTAPEVDWARGVWSREVRMACGDDGVVGDARENGPVSSSVTLRIVEGGRYLLRTSESSGEDGRDAAVRLGRCFGCPWDPYDVYMPAGESREVELEPGLYFMRYQAEDGGGPLLGAELTPVDQGL